MESTAVNITYEDQKRINRFSLLNKNFHEFEEEVKSLEEKLHSFEDALDEIELAAEDSATIMIGESFVTLTESQALDRLNVLKAECIAKLEKAKENIESHGKEMDELKGSLYAKFGKLINLDE